MESPAGKFSIIPRIGVGISYEYMGVILDARYNLGIVNVDNKSKSKNFTITVGYRFTL